MDSAAQTQPTQPAQPAECPVCWLIPGPDGWTNTDCGHSFCTACITQWLSTHDSCPVCRKQLVDRQPEPDPETMDEMLQAFVQHGFDVLRPILGPDLGLSPGHSLTFSAYGMYSSQFGDNTSITTTYSRM